ncbi:hypothetical protein MesoLjLc_74180 [Mesorhizobium sp. L-8-10]|uniref:DUF4160 domain-containing protein n=1 Tax=Mesorhizobium sp. L-8-10 TaxID=2744523 RepID=UPI001928188C|nr:DUF4160 domain-containing protein [Mesorhizobium sp. L-8-10]BCH35488.1 hypothetical protein MesoLjLc_74180 [Mesorhizobium sp. L-8-10]
MPTIAQIGNLRIQIFADDHNPPHFHVVTPEYQALVSIADLAIIRGELRGRDFNTAVEWAKAHIEELNHEWKRLNG